MNKDQQHIVFLRLMPPVLVWGGLEKLMMEWFERIDYHQCRVTLIVSTKAGDLYRQHIQAKHLPVEVLEFPFRTNFKYTEGFVKRLIRLFNFLKNLNPYQVVFFQGSFTDFDLAHIIAANWVSKGRVYMHENLGAPQPSPKSSRKYFGFFPGVGLWWYYEKYNYPLRARFCRKIYVVSAEIKDRMIKLWNYTADQLEVLYHGVDIQRFKSSKENKIRLRQQMGIAANETVLIVAARLSQEKCIDRAINAFDQLAEQNQSMMLFIAGTGPYEERLQQLAAEKNHAHKIKFLGQVSNVHELYQMSDIYILSSDNEGLSLAFLEALSSGLVCVVTRCTGTAEVIQNGINGFIVDKSLEGVCEGLRTAVNLTDVKREEIRRNAVQFVHERFEINRNVISGLKKMEIPVGQKLN